MIGSSRLTKPESLCWCYRITAFGIPRAQFAPCPVLGENGAAVRMRGKIQILLPEAGTQPILLPPATSFRPTRLAGILVCTRLCVSNSTQTPDPLMSSPIYSGGSRLSNSRKTALILAFALALAARAR